MNRISALGDGIKPPSDDAPHVLVVDDDQRIRKLIGRYLLENGFRATTARDVESARSAMEGLAFDLVVLDIMMPGVDGLAFARELRSGQFAGLPILMLTAQSEPDDRIKGLEAGVDDYLPKPFEPRELLLRINNILRRRATTSISSDEVRIGPFVFHVTRGELQRDGETIRLTERERDLLRQFAQQAGQPIPRHELVTDEGIGNERAIDVQINRLRRKIEVDPANPVYLQTVRGKGYILHTD
ncbi:MAG: response regulator [Rhizobiales bacterium]|nr:response regulator [Hyphomicrobiales bacterium]